MKEKLFVPSMFFQKNLKQLKAKEFVNPHFSETRRHKKWFLNSWWENGYQNAVRVLQL